MPDKFNEMGRLWTRAELAAEADISTEAMRKRQARGLHGLELIANESATSQNATTRHKVGDRILTVVEIALEAGVPPRAIIGRIAAGVSGNDLIAPPNRARLVWVDERWAAVEAAQEGGLTPRQEEMRAKGLTPIGAKPVEQSRVNGDYTDIKI